jgi:hypothetical protein
MRGVLFLCARGWEQMQGSARLYCAGKGCGVRYELTRGGWHTNPYIVHKSYKDYVTGSSTILCDACYKKITRVRSLRSILVLSASVLLVCDRPSRSVRVSLTTKRSRRHCIQHCESLLLPPPLLPVHHLNSTRTHR